MRFIDKVDKAKQLIKEHKEQKVAVACSFGKDSMVVLHLALQVDPQFPIFSVMTPFKPKETLQYKNYMTNLWRLNIRTYMDSFVGEQFNLYYTNPDACCQRYKVEPTRRAIHELGLTAWITGLRRTEGRTRINYDFVEERDGLVKVNPILDFTETDVWRYLAINQIPVNPLMLKGIGPWDVSPAPRRRRTRTRPRELEGGKVRKRRG